LEGHARNSHISEDYLHIPFFHDDATTTTTAAAALKKIHFHLPAKQKAKCAPSSFTNYLYFMCWVGKQLLPGKFKGKDDYLVLC
jgi:hypothetical protein